MKIGLLFVTLYLLTDTGFGQTCPCSIGEKVIIVNFQDKSVTTPAWNQDHYKRGDKIRICVTNCNPYLYKVVVNGTDSNQVPPAVGPIFSWILDPSNLSSIVSAVSASPAAAVVGAADLSAPEHMSLKQKIITRANNFTPTVNDHYRTELRINPDPVIALQNASNTFFTDYLTKIQNRTSEIATINSDIETMLYTLAGKTDFLFKNNTDDVTLHTDYITDMKNQYHTYKGQVDGKLAEIKGDQLQYFNDVVAFSDLYEKNKLLKSRDSLIGAFFSASITLLTKMDSTLSISEVLRRKPALLQLQAMSTTYLSLDQFYLKDIKDITVSISPWSDSASKLNSYNTTIELPVYHHFRFGIGAGFYMSGIGDQQYAIDSTIGTNSSGGADTTYKIQKDGKNNLEFGVSALVYGASSIGGKFYLGPSIGTGVSLSGATIRPRLFAGGTLVYGETNQVMVTAGWAFGNSQTLSDAFSLSKTYSSIPMNFTKNAMNNGLFVSVHYSFLSN
jgi:hypothetical protein